MFHQSILSEVLKGRRFVAFLNTEAAATISEQDPQSFRMKMKRILSTTL